MGKLRPKALKPPRKPPRMVSLPAHLRKDGRFIGYRAALYAQFPTTDGDVLDFVAIWMWIRDRNPKAARAIRLDVRKRAKTVKGAKS